MFDKMVTLKILTPIRMFCIVLVLMSVCVMVRAQKQPIDFAAIENWPHIRDEQISNDGKYITYCVSSEKGGTRLLIQSTDGSFIKEIKNGGEAIIAEDSRRILFKVNEDSLDLVDLETGNSSFLDKIISFKAPTTGKGRWVIYQKENSDSDLVLLDFYTGTRMLYHHTINYTIAKEGRFVLLQQKVLHNGEEMDSVTLLDLNNRISHFIWCGTSSSNWVIDGEGSLVAFIKKGMNNIAKQNELWYYQNEMDSARLLADSSTTGMNGSLVVEREIFFSPDGNNLFFYIQESEDYQRTDSVRNKEHYIIWSYKGADLSPSAEIPHKYFEAVVNLRSHAHVIQLNNKEGDYSLSYLIGCYHQDKVLLCGNWTRCNGKFNSRACACSDLYIVSTANGERKLLIHHFLRGWKDFGFSPSGKYVFWFDLVNGQWDTYNLKTGTQKTISTRIPFPLTDKSWKSGSYPPSLGLVGWLKNDVAMFVYDQYDIWQIDPSGKEPPRNITLAYGRTHHTRLRHVYNSDVEAPVFDLGDTLFLSAFNIVSKENGFAKIVLNQHIRLTPLVRGSRLYYGANGGVISIDPSGYVGLKARDATAYIFRPTCDTIYPNLCFTKDLVQFQQLTSLEPQKQYNWYTDELVHWKQRDGIVNAGILFKPEDFDPRKKYPLIFYIYEKFSEDLNAYLSPAFPTGDLGILWYISHGYLVFLPDIQYVVGHPGRSAYNSVVSAIHYLSGRPWIDLKRLGLQGHSFGGYETNYIVSKTNLFAAACSADGVSDIVSEFDESLDATAGNQSFFELGQGRMGNSLWQSPNHYIEESPIFRADKVATPLLIVHNPLDFNVPFSQGIEWFTALRWLGKKAWMLQYDNEGHTIQDESNQKDFTIRVQQFFDHYLKDAPAPEWMKGER